MRNKVTFIEGVRHYTDKNGRVWVITKKTFWWAESQDKTDAFRCDTRKGLLDKIDTFAAIQVVEKDKVLISDLLDVIHFAIIKNLGENDIILDELTAIDNKIKAKRLVNYPVKGVAIWETLKNSLK